MAEEQSVFRTFINKRSILIANIVIFSALAWNFTREFKRSTNLESEITRLEEKKQVLERKNAELTSLSHNLVTSSALEREAREKLGLQLPGESVVVVKDEVVNTEEQSQDQQLEQPHSALANAQLWWHYFFQ
jgi:cell division protein FtsB